VTTREAFALFADLVSRVVEQKLREREDSAA
jgi:hypothetical protein